MSRLFDHIYWHRSNMSIKAKAFSEYVMARGVAISADNVAKYYLTEENISKERTWEERRRWLFDLPNVMPPFNPCFIEMKNPAYGDGPRVIHTPFGSHTEDPRYDKSQLLAFPMYWGLLFWATGEVETIGRTDYGKSAAAFKFTLFHQYERLPQLAEDSSAYFVTDKLGRILDFQMTDPTGDEWDFLIDPVFVALSLMNCKNVELIDNLPPAGLSRKHERRTGEPLVTYKTIKVNPLRTAKHPTDPDAPPAPESNGNSADMPLSIWRGHFKDYRDGKGLFGKFKEVYWWDQHVRGDIENGATIKDYDVLAPRDDSK